MSYVEFTSSSESSLIDAVIEKEKETVKDSSLPSTVDVEPGIVRESPLLAPSALVSKGFLTATRNLCLQEAKPSETQNNMKEKPTAQKYDNWDDAICTQPSLLLYPGVQQPPANVPVSEKRNETATLSSQMPFLFLCANNADFLYNFASERKQLQCAPSCVPTRNDYKLTYSVFNALIEDRVKANEAKTAVEGTSAWCSRGPLEISTYTLSVEENNKSNTEIENGYAAGLIVTEAVAFEANHVGELDQWFFRECVASPRLEDNDFLSDNNDDNNNRENVFDGQIFFYVDSLLYVEYQGEGNPFSSWYEYIRSKLEAPRMSAMLSALRFLVGNRCVQLIETCLIDKNSGKVVGLRCVGSQKTVFNFLYVNALEHWQEIPAVERLTDSTLNVQSAAEKKLKALSAITAEEIDDVTAVLRALTLWMQLEDDESVTAISPSERKNTIRNIIEGLLHLEGRSSIRKRSSEAKTSSALELMLKQLITISSDLPASKKKYTRYLLIVKLYALTVFPLVSTIIRLLHEALPVKGQTSSKNKHDHKGSNSFYEKNLFSAYIPGSETDSLPSETKIKVNNWSTFFTYKAYLEFITNTEKQKIRLLEEEAFLEEVEGPVLLDNFLAEKDSVRALRQQARELNDAASDFSAFLQEMNLNGDLTNKSRGDQKNVPETVLAVEVLREMQGRKAKRSVSKDEKDSSTMFDLSALVFPLSEEFLANFLFKKLVEHFPRLVNVEGMTECTCSSLGIGTLFSFYERDWSRRLKNCLSPSSSSSLSNALCVLYRLNTHQVGASLLNSMSLCRHIWRSFLFQTANLCIQLPIFTFVREFLINGLKSFIFLSEEEKHKTVFCFNVEELPLHKQTLFAQFRRAVHALDFMLCYRLAVEHLPYCSSSYLLAGISKVFTCTTTLWMLEQKKKMLHHGCAHCLQAVARGYLERRRLGRLYTNAVSKLVNEANLTFLDERMQEAERLNENRESLLQDAMRVSLSVLSTLSSDSSDASSSFSMTFKVAQTFLKTELSQLIFTYRTLEFQRYKCERQAREECRKEDMWRRAVYARSNAGSKGKKVATTKSKSPKHLCVGSIEEEPSVHASAKDTADIKLSQITAQVVAYADQIMSRQSTLEETNRVLHHLDKQQSRFKRKEKSLQGQKASSITNRHTNVTMFAPNRSAHDVKLHSPSTVVPANMRKNDDSLWTAQKELLSLWELSEFQ